MAQPVIEHSSLVYLIASLTDTAALLYLEACTNEHEGDYCACTVMYWCISTVGALLSYHHMTLCAGIVTVSTWLYCI